MPFFIPFLSFASFHFFVIVVTPQVYIIDFGLAKRYRDSTTNRHIPYRLPLSLGNIPVFSGSDFFLDISGRITKTCFLFCNHTTSNSYRCNIFHSVSEMVS